ncbi:hypothetical protein [Streptomyces sp. AC555_RSS877]|uniref:hypothetical protein n=1 Tax=Streptomyces sp. AC555_RSS877 TaxID=2823688 RepID=UPI001C25A5A2|nr:hypothetical protein [Streptomyces sp. AC555_RSS877]
MRLTHRIKRRISEDYTPEDRSAVEELLLDLASGLEKDEGFSQAELERIIAATLIGGGGDVDRLLNWVQFARRDFRDVLVGSGLEHSDWPERLDSEFGTDS